MRAIFLGLACTAMAAVPVASAQVVSPLAKIGMLTFESKTTSFDALALAERGVVQIVMTPPDDPKVRTCNGFVLGMGKDGAVNLAYHQMLIFSGTSASVKAAPGSSFPCQARMMTTYFTK